MKKKRSDRLLLCFLKEHRLYILFFLLSTGIFAFLFALYNLPMKAVFYPALLSAALGLLLFGKSFHSYSNAHRKRQEQLQQIELYYDQLENDQTLAGEDYREMIRALGKINIDNQTRSKEREKDSMDYYTTWVHQIKTPISVMQMILQNEDTEEHRELRAELFRIEQYVEMVLSYLRLQSGSTDYVIQEYPLDDIIRQAIRKYAPQFIRKKIKLDYKPTDAIVLTDEKWLLFILEQLLSNALKYTVNGSIEISVSDDLVLSVKDTGIGIAPEDLPRIFEKGFTGYNGRADKKSTGLGLYLCKQAADRLSIGISARSTPKVGSVFCLDLKSSPLSVE